MRTPLRIVLGLVALAAVGCGGTADVTGKVSFQGKPVVYGTVVVIGSDGTPKSGQIQPDGSYSVRGVPTGAAKVSVSSPPPPGRETKKKAVQMGRDAVDPDKPPPPTLEAAPAEVLSNWTAIPNKYGDPAQSGLTTDVGSGPFDIDLK